MATCARALACAQARAREHEGALAWRSITWIPHIDAADLVTLYQAPGPWFSLLYMKVSACRLKPSPLFEIAVVIVRPDHVARVTVNANHSVM
jgi:hypothetical protein